MPKIPTTPGKEKKQPEEGSPVPKHRAGRPWEQVPTLGRIVLYRTDGRNGLSYDLPAIITCTQETHPGDYPNGKHNPLPVPSSPTHVHLTVFSPGGFGTTVEGRDPEDDRDFVGAERIQPGSGSYVEWDVPQFDVEDSGMPVAGSWRWPNIQR